MTNSKFQSSILVSVTAELWNRKDIKPGQWFRSMDGTRGQYLGTTSTGNVVVRFQNHKFGTKGDGRQDARDNKTLRNYAKAFGG